MTDDDWQTLVPEVILRPQQFQALKEIWEHFESGAEVVFAELPCGVGKSLIQLALARKISESGGTSFLVTPQRALQAQLGLMSTDLAVMKGKGSYHCLVSDCSAASAPCTVLPEIRQTQSECAIGSCPFYTALDSAQKSSIVVHNYASLLAQAYIGEHFGKRQLLCLDEGHTAASWIRNFATFEVDLDELQELTTEDAPEKPAEFIAWFVAVIMDMESIPQGLSDGLKITMLRAMAFRSSFGVVPWGATFDRQEARWTLVPLKVAPIAWLLTGLGEKVLITSATILHRRLMAAELGMGKKDVRMVTIDSAFKPDNRPVVRRYCGSMSMKSKQRTMEPMLNALGKIAMDHRLERGLVHTVSHALAKDVGHFLMAHDPRRNIVVLPSGSERDATIREFVSGGWGPNAILVAPSLMEGFDGKDDVARWQAICKVPWPNMGDLVVSHLMAMKGEAGRFSQAWYAWKTAQLMVQGIGRVCRTPHDHGVTYLLDSSAEKVLRSGYVPKYVLDAVR